MSLAKKSSIIIILLALAAAGAVGISRHMHRGITGMGEEFAQKISDKIGFQIGLAPKPSWVGQYLSGYHATSAKDYEKASDYFSGSLNLRADSETLQTQAMSLLLVSGKFSEAVQIAKTMQKTNNGLARLTLIVDAIQNNKLDEAERLTTDQKGDAGTIINHVIEAWIKYGKGQKPEAENILKSLRKSDEAFLPFVDYNYALIANLSGDKKTATELYDSLVKIAQLPNSIVSSAYAFYKDQNNAEKLALIKSKFNYDGAVSKHPAVTNVKQGVAEALLGVGSIILTEYSPDKSAALFRLALYLNPELDDSKLLLGSILMTEGDYKGANEILSGIKQDSYLGDYAKLAIAKNFEAMDDDTKAKQYFELLTQNKETAIDAYVSLGDLARKKESYQEAADYYTKSIAIATAEAKDGKIAAKYWALYFARGVCYERLKDMDKSEADLLAALKLEPNQPDVMNYLAYTWIDDGKNLAKAKDMVLKAHEEKPDDPQITDSLGWAYFKLGDFNDSVDKLEEAATLLPYDPTVNDHLGDAYWQTGRKNEAKFQWERALKNDPEPKLAESLKKKLENGIAPDNAATPTQTSNAG